MQNEAVNINKLLSDEYAKHAAPRKFPVFNALKRNFQVISRCYRYRLDLPDLATRIEITKLKRHDYELHGVLTVTCDLPGARTVNGSLFCDNFNLTSARVRAEKAKMLGERSGTAKEVDWLLVVEEFCIQVIQDEQKGELSFDLRSMPLPTTEQTFFTVQGIRLWHRHPTILFGDGGTAKSYLGLYFAGKAAEFGMRVGYFDWELTGEDHRVRLERLFPDGMPRIEYVICEHPLSFEADRLNQIVVDNSLDFLIYDSIVFACDGKPEDAEVAQRYFRAARHIGVGGLHIAHIAKRGDGTDQKPFGSVFWNNGARSTWFIECGNADSGDDFMELALFNRKCNLGQRQAPIGLNVVFDETAGTTTIQPGNLTENPTFVEKLSIVQRMASHLKKGAMSTAGLAEELDVKKDTIERTLRRHRERFVVLRGGLIGLSTTTSE